MNDEKYWGLIDFDEKSGWVDDRLSKIGENISNLSLDECLSFFSWMLRKINELRNDKMGCAYFLISEAFTTDDSFLSFMDTAILIGRQGYEELLESPDNLINYPVFFALDECLLLSPLYEKFGDDLGGMNEKFGENLSKKIKHTDVNFSDFSEDECKNNCPKLYSKFGPDIWME